MRKTKNKKAVEQPQVIIYVLFTVILVIAGIYIGFTQLGGIDYQFKFLDYNEKANLIATQLLANPDCLALENSYSYYGQIPYQYYQVWSGIINITSGKPKPDCINSLKNTGLPFYANITNVSEFRDRSGNTCSIVYSQEIKPYGYPTSDWKNITRTYLVLLLSGECTAPGKLTLVLKGGGK